MMQIFILNGGAGSRVKNISKKKPKCLIKFNKKPFLYYQLRLLKKSGFDDIVLCLGYKAIEIVKYLNKNKKLSKNVRYTKERNKLDTGGALVNSKKLMNEIFFVTFGDSYLNINYKKILRFFKKKNYSSLITVIKKQKVPYHKANIFISKNKIISNKSGKNSNFIDYGLMIFKKQVFSNYSLKKIPLRKVIKELIDNKDICFVKINKKFNEIGSEYGIENFKNYINK